MSEQSVTYLQQYPEQLSDILLVIDKEKKKIQAVTGIDENGNLKTIDPNKKNQSQFIRVDKNGDLFSNFFSNFWRQLKDPTRFAFFKVSAVDAAEKAKTIQQQIYNPTKEGEAIIAKHAVKEPNEQQQQQQQQQQQGNKKDMETTQTKPESCDYRFKVEQVDWENMNNLGLSKERLEKAGVLDTLLRGYKTNILMPISLNLGTAVTRMDARLSLQQGDNDSAVVAIHGIRKEPGLDKPFFGYAFTKEDKEQLLKTGNMGHVVDLTNPKTGEKIPSIISIDRLTNEVVALRQEWIKVPDEIKGVKLNEEQKQILLEGKPLYVENMLSKKGETFSANLQYNADKRFIEFLFDRNYTNQQSQNLQNGLQQGQSPEIPKTFRGKTLTDEQYEKYNDGKTVFVDGLIDKKGEMYQGYITFNKETGKADFSFTHPDKINNKVQPAESNKIQVAVNSDGKNNEATKNIKEPLKPKQQTPKDRKQQQQKPLPTAKSKGIKR